MNKNQELDRLWALMVSADRELSREAKSCVDGKVTAHYKKIKADSAKLKNEYEKLKGGGSFNPNSLADRETMTQRAVFGSFMGQIGPDSHIKKED